MCMLGFRFNPTDEELIDHFLKHKIAGDDFMVNNIAHIQVFNFEPWDLPALSKMKDDKEWFFFTSLDKINKTRYNRKTKDGSWKKTGKDRKIRGKGTKTIIGLKRTLVFNINKNGHEKIKWIIHEYHADETMFPHNKTNLVLSRLMKRDEQVTDSSSNVSAADFEKQPMLDLAQDNETLHILETMQIGYRFHPTDEELLNFYLEHKLVGNDSLVSNIPEVNLNIIEPWELPALSKISSEEWYFFTTDVLKYKKGTKCTRTTNAGYWKKTGKTREIKIKGTNNVVGTKTIFVFYKYCGSHVEKTNFVIHQYDAIKVPDNKRNFVLCRLTEKTEVERDELMYDEGASSHVVAGAAATDLTPNVCGSPEVNMEYNLLLLASPHEDDYSFSEYRFPAAISQTPYYEGLTSSNAYFEIENRNAGFLFETDEENNTDYISFFN